MRSRRLRSGTGKQVESSTASRRQPTWSLLQTQWLDVPIDADLAHARPTWGAFSEHFERCLRDVSLHVSRRLDGRERLEAIVTEVIVENLHLLVSDLGEREKLDRLIGAADRLIAQSTAARKSRTKARPKIGV